MIGWSEVRGQRSEVRSQKSEEFEVLTKFFLFRMVSICESARCGGAVPVQRLLRRGNERRPRVAVRRKGMLLDALANWSLPTAKLANPLRGLRAYSTRLLSKNTRDEKRALALLGDL